MKKKFLWIFRTLLYLLLIAGNVLPAAVVLAQDPTGATPVTVSPEEAPGLPESERDDPVASSSTSSPPVEESAATISSSSTTEVPSLPATDVPTSSSTALSESAAPESAFRSVPETSEVSSTPARAVDDSFAAELRIFTEDTNEDGSEKLEYWTGEGVNPYAEFRISGTGVSIQHAKTRLTVPKKYVENRPQFTKIASAESWEMKEDENNWYAEYSFNVLAGGQIVATPFPYSMQQPETPNGFRTPVVYELFDGEGRLLKSATKTFIAKANPSRPINIVSDSGQGTGADSIMTGVDKKRETLEGETVITATIGVQKEADKERTFSDERAPHATFLIGIEAADGKYGKYRPTTIKVVEHLPAGAVMQGKPTAAGYYVYNGYKWSYDPQGHTATYEGPAFTYIQDKTYYVAELRLSFPNQPYSTIHLNRATIIAEPGTPEEVTLGQVEERLKWHPVMVTPSGRGKISKSAYKQWPSDGLPFNPNNRNTDTDVRYSISVRNEANNVVDEETGKPYTTYVKELVDFDLDNRLYYSYLQLAPYDSIDPIERAGGYKVYGESADGTRTFLFEGDLTRSKQPINDTNDQYEKLVIVFENPVALAGNKAGVWFYVGTTVKEEVWSQWRTTGLRSDDVPYDRDQEQRLYNSLEASISNRADGPYTKGITDAATFFRGEVRGIRSDHGNSYTVSYSDNNIRKLYGFVLLNGQLAPVTDNNPESSYVLKNVQYITLLPPGIEFVPGSETKEEFQNKARVIPNYKNTGKTAVIYHLGDLIRSHGKRVEFDVDTTLSAQTGDNEIEHFVTWDNNDEYTRWEGDKENYTDALDLDGDGNTEEVFLRGTNTIHFIPPREVVVKKFVSLDKEHWSLSAPYADLGQDVYYKLSIFNNSLIPLEDVSLLDVLPYVGDHKIVANDAGDYLSRESVFPVQLAESIEAIAENRAFLQKFDVLYSTDVQGPTLASTRDAHFVPAASITDFTQVTLVKFVLKSGQVLQVKEEIGCILHGTLPYDEKLDNFARANNSGAFSLNKVDYIEGNQVSSPIVHYQVDGTFFYDVNRDGTRSDDEPLLKGYQVQLMNEDGTQALDREGRKITAETDENGYYRMAVYKRGNYYVQVVKKHENEEFTRLHDGVGTRLEKDQFIGNDTSQDVADSSLGKTRLLVLDPSNIPSSLATSSKEELAKHIRETPTSLIATRNVGLLPTGSIKIVKVDEQQQPLKDVAFTLKKGDFSLLLRTDDRGEAAVTGLDPGSYTLTEDETGAAYVLDTKDREVTLGKDQLEVTVTVVNKLKRSTVVLTKTDHDTGQALAGVIFEVRQGDKVIASAKTDDEGQVTFTDLAYGDYQLVETATLASHVLDTTPIPVSVTEHRVVIEKTLTNRRKKATLVLKKVDASTKKALAGVTFELRQGDKVIDTQVTDAQGLLTFKDVVYGDYTVVETQALAGYVVADKPQAVSVTEDGAMIDLGQVENHLVPLVPPIVTPPTSTTSTTPPSGKPVAHAAIQQILPKTGAALSYLSLLGFLLLLGLGLYSINIKLES